MRSLFIIVILGISSKCGGQNSPHSKIDKFSFKGIEARINKSEKLKLLQKLVSTKYFSVNINSTESYGFGSYHVVDFNADGKLDVIYDGREPSGIETNNVAFFLNNGDSLRLVVKLNGDFTRIDLQNGNLQGFQLILTPCCDNSIYSIKNFKLSDSSNCFSPENSDDEQYKYTYGQVNEPDFCVSLESVYRYVHGTEFPRNGNSKDTMYFNQEAFLVTMSQLTNNGFQSIITKGTRCYILADRKFNKSAFCFVMVEIEDSMATYDKKVKTYHYGWIDKEYLE